MSNPTDLPPQLSSPTTSDAMLDAFATLIQTLQNAKQQPQQQPQQQQPQQQQPQQQQQLQQPQVQTHQHQQSTSYQGRLQAPQQELLQPQRAQTQQPQPRQLLTEGPGTQYRQQRRGNTGSFGHPQRVQLFNQPLQALNTQYASTQTTTLPSTGTSGISAPATSTPATPTPIASSSTQSLQASAASRKIKLIWEAWLLPYNQGAFDSPQQCAGFVSTHEDRAVFDFEYFFNTYCLLELERQDGFVEAKAMYFTNSELQYTLYDELPSKDSPGTTIPWTTISERTLSEIVLEHGQAIYEQQPAKRGRPGKIQAPKLKGYKFHIGIRPKPAPSAMAIPTATRSSSVEYVDTREREEAYNDDYDYQTIWYGSDTESLPSMRSLLRAQKPQSHKLPIRSSPAGSNQQTPRPQRVREAEQQPIAADPTLRIASTSEQESAPEFASPSALESASASTQTEPKPMAPESSAAGASRRRAVSKTATHPPTKRSRPLAPSSGPSSTSDKVSSSAPKGVLKSKKRAFSSREYNLRWRPGKNGSSN